MKTNKRFKLNGLSKFHAVSLLGCLAVLVGTTRAETRHSSESGIAWGVKGGWQIEGVNRPIRTGDTIEPGTLLEATGGPGHSITVLLPDGQSIWYECFQPADCARGFRVPAIYAKPAPSALELMSHMQSVFGGDNADSRRAEDMLESDLPRDEVVAALDASKEVHIQGLASSLSNGRYTYDLKPLDERVPAQTHLAFEKTGPTLTVPLPGPGLYVINITDDTNSPRINVLIGAVSSEQAAKIAKPLAEARKLLKEWNEFAVGWPPHDVLRLYITSLVSETTGKQSSQLGGEKARLKTSVGRIEDRAKTTAEPTFSPMPGLSKGKVEVTLSCATPGATIRYTADNSQPLAGSDVAHAPIVVSGTEVIIKAYATSPGKKDSPVVTGTFRIDED